MAYKLQKGVIMLTNTITKLISYYLALAEQIQEISLTES